MEGCESLWDQHQCWVCLEQGCGSGPTHRFQAQPCLLCVLPTERKLVTGTLVGRCWEGAAGCRWAVLHLPRVLFALLCCQHSCPSPFTGWASPCVPQDPLPISVLQLTWPLGACPGLHPGHSTPTQGWGTEGVTARNGVWAASRQHQGMARRGGSTQGACSRHWLPGHGPGWGGHPVWCPGAGPTR